MWWIAILLLPLESVSGLPPWRCLSLCDHRNFQEPAHHVLRYTAPGFAFADFNQRHSESGPSLHEITPIEHSESFPVSVPDLGDGVGHIDYEFSEDQPWEFRIVPVIDYPVLLSLARARQQRILSFELVIRVRRATLASLHALSDEVRGRVVGTVWPSLHQANPITTYLVHDEDAVMAAAEGSDEGSHVSHPAVYLIPEVPAISPSDTAAMVDRHLHVEWTIRYSTVPAHPRRVPSLNGSSSRHGQGSSRGPHD